MNRLGYNPTPSTPTSGQRVGVRETGSVQASRKRKSEPGTNISIQPEAVFSDSAIRGLIDEWIVPMLVEKFIDNRIVRQSQEEKETP
jgi:hypothetical protein